MVGGCLACALAFAVPADAADVGPTPLVDCVAVSGDGSSVTAFFGYADADTGRGSNRHRPRQLLQFLGPWT